eukprot:445839_1
MPTPNIDDLEHGDDDDDDDQFQPNMQPNIQPNMQPDSVLDDVPNIDIDIPAPNIQPNMHASNIQPNMHAPASNSLLLSVQNSVATLLNIAQNVSIKMDQIVEKMDVMSGTMNILDERLTHLESELGYKSTPQGALNVWMGLFTIKANEINTSCETLLGFCEGVGSNIFSLDEIEYSDEELFACKACALILNSDKKKKKTNIDDEYIIDRRDWANGWKVNKSDARDQEFWDWTLRRDIKDHCKNKTHIEGLNKLAEWLAFGKDCIVTKCEMAYTIFARGGAYIWFEWLIHLLYRICKMHNCSCINTGDYLDCLKEMQKWRDLFYDYHMDNYKTYLKSKNTEMNVHFCSCSGDGWSADKQTTGEVLGIFTQSMEEDAYVIPAAFQEYEYNPTWKTVKDCEAIIDLFEIAFEELGIHLKDIDYNLETNEDYDLYDMDRPALKVVTSNCTDWPYLNQYCRDTGISEIILAFIRRFGRQPMFVHWWYDHQHGRERWRRLTSKEMGEELELIIKIIKQGLKSMGTHKWYCILKYFWPEARKFRKFADIKFWQWITPSLDRIIDNYGPSIKVQISQVLLKEKHAAFRDCWQTLSWIGRVIILREIMFDIIDIGNIFNHKIHRIHPGEYWNREIREKALIDEGTEELKRLNSIVYNYSDDIFDPNFEFVNLCNMINSGKIFCRFQRDLCQLLQCQYQGIHLKVHHFEDGWDGDYEDWDPPNEGGLIDNDEKDQVERSEQEENDEKQENYEENDDENCENDDENEAAKKEKIEQMKREAERVLNEEIQKIIGGNTNDNKTIFGSTCSGECTGEMIQCSASYCRKWFCKEHLIDALGCENAEQYGIEVGDKFWLCCDCGSQICDIIDFGLKFLKIFKRIAYGDDRTDRMDTHNMIEGVGNDRLWYGLCPPRIVDDAIEHGLEHIMEEKYFEDGINDFHDLYQDYKKITANTIFQPCFNNLEQDTKNGFIDLKKEICGEIQRVLLINQENESKINVRKVNDELLVFVKKLLQEEFKEFRLMYDHHRSMLRHETIIEVICSFLGHTCSPRRKNMLFANIQKNTVNKLSHASRNGKERTIITGHVGQRYYNKYLKHGIITNKKYLKKRKNYDKSKSVDKYEKKKYR